MEENTVKIQLTRKQFMAVYHAADLLTDMPEEYTMMEIPKSHGRDIVGVTFALWALYDACGGTKRRLESNK